jgi:hypothetical protein
MTADHTFTAVLVHDNAGALTVIDEATHSTVHGSPLPEEHWAVKDAEGNPDRVYTAVIMPNPDSDDTRVYYRAISYFHLAARP